jgi:two-component system KDP operon response regulator KdpE
VKLSALIVEDEPQMAKFLATLLESEGWAVDVAASKGRAQTSLAAKTPKIVILDLMLGGESGLDLIREIREWSSIPIIVVSAQYDEDVKVEALDLGANDYLTKPFGSGEFMARVRVALRHADATESNDEPVFENQRIRVDFVAREVTVSGERIHLTPTEYRLLVYLVRNAGRVLTHRQILKHVWGPSFATRPHYVRIYMANLRSKIELDSARPAMILTETGVGYRFNEETVK